MRYKNVFSALIIIVLFFSITAFTDGVTKYRIDRGHSYLGFTVRHMLLAKVRGEFNDYSIDIMFDETNIANSSVEVTIQSASINTRHERRDGHLKSPDFLDVEKYPEIKYKSKEIKKTDNGFVALGTLTMRGVSKEVELPFTMSDIVVRRSKKRFAIEGGLMINRQDYGMKFSRMADNGGLIAGNEITIDFSIEAVETD